MASKAEKLFKLQMAFEEATDAKVRRELKKRMDELETGGTRSGAGAFAEAERLRRARERR